MKLLTCSGVFKNLYMGRWECWYNGRLIAWISVMQFAGLSNQERGWIWAWFWREMLRRLG